MKRPLTKTVRRRPGFTLIELLVVIAIIAILLSLTAVGVFRLIGTQQGHNTKSELTACEGQHQKQWSAVAAKARGEKLPPPAGTKEGDAYNLVLNTWAGGNKDIAKVIWVKLRMKQAFPNNFNEALNPAPLTALPHYAKTLGDLGYTAANTTTAQPWESSVCLLMALQRGDDGVGVKMEDLGVAGNMTDFGPTPNGGKIKGLVDGWHNPLVVCRWPVGSTQLNPSGPQAGANDPDDPENRLASASWVGSTGRTTFQQYCHPLPAAAGQSYRIFPMIASAGPDGQLGLDPNTFGTTNAAFAKDNLYAALAP